MAKTRTPLDMISDDRAQARRLDDPNADLCFLALADGEGNASIRTLVMREITGNHFRVFMNQSSPKWKVLTSGGTYQLLLWYPTMQRQYRVNGGVQTLDPEIVKQNWLRRPRGSKYLDLLYENVVDQSTFIDSRDYLVEEINKIKAAYKLEDMQAPDKVAGIELIAERIEMLDLNREDRIHDRRMFVRQNDGTWETKVMIP